MEIEVAIKKLKKVLQTYELILNIENEEEREIEMSSYFEEMPYWEIKALVEQHYQDKSKIKKLKRKVKELNTLLGQFIDDSISKDELKKIVDECIPKKENMITGELEYTTNANANSFLTQEILKLLEDEEFE